MEPFKKFTLLKETESVTSYNTTMETTAPKVFEKIFIKSVEDLPEIYEEGYTQFTVGVKGQSEFDTYSWFNYSINYGNGAQAQREYWLNTFDWYLKPVDHVSYGREEIIKVLKKHLYKGLLGNLNIDTEIESIATELSETKDGVKESRLSEVKDDLKCNSCKYLDIDGYPCTKCGDNSRWEKSEVKDQYGYPLAGTNNHVEFEVKESGNEVTDEDVIIYFNNHSNCQSPMIGSSSSYIPTMSRSAVLEFAKWLRSRLHPAPPLTDEQIEKWANHFQPIRGGYISDYIYSAKAMQSGTIREWVKNQK